jgi:hypothetical protein
MVYVVIVIIDNHVFLNGLPPSYTHTHTHYYMRSKKLISVKLINPIYPLSNAVFE